MTDLEKAKSPSTSLQILAVLAKHEIMAVRLCVDQNLSSKPEILSILANDSDLVVRRAVAENPATSPKELTDLATDSDWYVRYCVAKHPKSPLESWELLNKEAKGKMEKIHCYTSNR